MNTQCIVTTTIQEPQPALLKLIALADWDIIVSGDIKTPHDSYLALDEKYENFTYLLPKFQDIMDEELSRNLGWNCIQRRNMALLFAYKRDQYKVIGTFDDDNIIYDDWDGTTMVGQTIMCDEYTTKLPALDPFAVIGLDYHHRGYPLMYIKARNKELVHYNGKKDITVGVEVPVPEGDPDIDAITRIMVGPTLKLSETEKAITFPFTSDKIMPFNSQCTFLDAKLIPYYMMLTDVGRHDDILGAYLLQQITKCKVVFSKPIAYQDRNEHDLTVDLSKENFGYCNSAKFIEAGDDQLSLLPQHSQDTYKMYKRAMGVN